MVLSSDSSSSCSYYGAEVDSISRPLASALLVDAPVVSSVIPVPSSSKKEGREKEKKKNRRERVSKSPYGRICTVTDISPRQLL